MNLLERRRARMRRDEGFSLIEVVVALGLMAVILLALLSSSVFAVQATVDARKNQQAADYLNQAIETARGLDYADAVLLTSQVTGDPAVVTTAGVARFDPGSGPEPIASSTTGTVRPQRETMATANGTFTVKRYVTVPAGTPTTAQGLPAVRRMTAVVSWETRTGTKTRQSSTLMTSTRRGLPLPNFTWRYNGPATVVANVPTWTKNPGNDVSYGLVLNNLGARDGWTVTASTSGWSYYVDTDKDGLWSGDPLTEPALTVASTGLIEPGSLPYYLVAHRTIGLGESGTTQTVFTATSEAITTVAKTVTTSLTVQSGAVVMPTSSPAPTPTASSTAAPATCTPTTEPSITASDTVPTASTQNQYTLKTIRLYSTGSGDTTAAASNTMGTDSSALGARLCNWSTDLHTNLAGRHLAASSDGTASATAKRMEFFFQPGSATENEYRGTPVLSLYAQCPSTAPTLTVTLLTLSGATYTSRSVTSWPLTGCSGGGFTRFSTQLTAGTFAMGITDRLVLRISSSTPVRLGYGTNGAASALTIGMK